MTEVEIIIDTSEDHENIILTFIAEDKNISVGFSLGEAQLLSSYLSDALTNILLRKLNIEPSPDIKH